MPVFLSERLSSSEPSEPPQEEDKEEKCGEPAEEELNLCSDEEAEGDETTIRQDGEELNGEETQQTLPLIGEKLLSCSSGF